MAILRQLAGGALSNECDGDRLDCDNGGRVRQVRLDAATGTLTAQLAQLTELVSLQVRYRGDAALGQIPDLSALRGLTHLALDGVSGTLPSSLAQLTELRTLTIASADATGASNVSLRGSIPSELALLRNLAELDLSNNQLSGVIPRFRGVQFCVLTTQRGANCFESESCGTCDSVCLRAQIGCDPPTTVAPASTSTAQVTPSSDSQTSTDTDAIDDSDPDKFPPLLIVLIVLGIVCCCVVVVVLLISAVARARRDVEMADVHTVPIEDMSISGSEYQVSQYQDVPRDSRATLEVDRPHITREDTVVHGDQVYAVAPAELQENDPEAYGDLNLGLPIEEGQYGELELN